MLRVRSVFRGGSKNRNDLRLKIERKTGSRGEDPPPVSPYAILSMIPAY